MHRPLTASPFGLSLGLPIIIKFSLLVQFYPDEDVLTGDNFMYEFNPQVSLLTLTLVYKM